MEARGQNTITGVRFIRCFRHVRNVEVQLNMYVCMYVCVYVSGVCVCVCAVVDVTHQQRTHLPEHRESTRASPSWPAASCIVPAKRIAGD